MLGSNRLTQLPTPSWAPSLTPPAVMRERPEINSQEFWAAVVERVSPLYLVSLHDNLLASTTLPPWLFALPVFTLDLSANRGLVGTLPAFFGLNPLLREINLDGCGARGRIPDGFDRCSALWAVCVLWVGVFLNTWAVLNAQPSLTARVIIIIIQYSPPPFSPTSFTAPSHAHAQQPQPQRRHAARQPAERPAAAVAGAAGARDRAAADQQPADRCVVNERTNGVAAVAAACVRVAGCLHHPIVSSSSGGF